VTGTPEFIDTLVANAAPVRRLRSPLLRAGLWLLLALLIVGLLALTHGVRSDLLEQFARPAFAVSTAGALATGILAAIAAFITSLPDRSRLWALLPVPALLVWISTIGYGCLTDWVSVGPEDAHMGEAVRCFATLLLTSVPLSIVMAVMLRNAAIVSAPSVILCGSVAIAAITSAALALLHDLDATMMVLIWTLGTAVLISSLGAAFGRKLLLWISVQMMRGSVDAARLHD
jgi:hypothetical protein